MKNLFLSFILSGFVCIFSLNSFGQVNSINLNQPTDLDTIYDLSPTFTWNAIGISERTSFSLKLCKVEELQSPEAAINSNVPILFLGTITNPSQMYPPTQPDLDSSSRYAWQVTMYDTGIPVALSDLFSFYTPYPPLENYLFWKLELKNINKIFAYPKLTLNYNNIYNVDSLTISVTSLLSRELVFNKELVVKSGTNYLVLNKHPEFPILQDGSYLVSISNLANEHFNFTYIKK